MTGRKIKSVPFDITVQVRVTGRVLVKSYPETDELVKHTDLHVSYDFRNGEKELDRKVVPKLEKLTGIKIEKDHEKNFIVNGHGMIGFPCYMSDVADPIKTK